MDKVKVITADFVNLQISTSNNEMSLVEKRYPKDISIEELKTKLELITGGSSSTMQLEAYDKNNKLITRLDDNSKLLGYYPLEDGMRIHVIDDFLLQKEFDNSNVPKFELSKEQYAERKDSVKSFLMTNKLGKYDEQYMAHKKQQELLEKALTDTILPGSRCRVNVTGAPARLGTVKYSGTLDNLNGHWIGVEYDEPYGKHNGTHKGKQYFKCRDHYGAFVKPQCVELGDFPPLDDGLNDIDEI